jgi:hypothetical protein
MCNTSHSPITTLARRGGWISVEHVAGHVLRRQCLLAPDREGVRMVARPDLVGDHIGICHDLVLVCCGRDTCKTGGDLGSLLPSGAFYSAWAFSSPVKFTR